jgi:3-hydroxyisobutyrate dehydrogenase-like beta-hydroxyacid dehydrogenase
MSGKTRIGFIGLGQVGKPMSKGVLRGGYPLTVHDVRAEAVEELVKAGARKADTPKEVAEASDVVITSLPTLKASEEVYLGKNGLLKGTKPGDILVETSTITPNIVKKFSEEAKKQGVVVLDGSLYGRTFFHPETFELSQDAIGEKGAFAVLMGGEPEEVEKVRPILSTFGNPILHLGPLGSGALAKVLGNAIIHAYYAVVCEMFALGAKAGLNIEKLHQVFANTGAKSWIVDTVSGRYLKEGKGFLMRTELAAKDAEAMIQVGAELGVPLPMQSVTQLYYEWAKNGGFKDRPWDEIMKMWEGLVGRPIRFNG